MDKRFENRLIMLRAIVRLLKLNETIWRGSTPMVAAFAELERLITKIEQIQQLTGDNNSGLVTSKKLQRVALEKAVFELASVLLAFASRVKKSVLLGKVNFPVSELQMVRDTKLALIGETIAGLGRSNLQDIVEYGITEDKLNSLDVQIAQYKLSIPAPRVSVAEIKAGNEKLKETMTEARDLVNSQIDRMVVQLEASHPEFYAAYRNARKIVDYGTRYEKPEEPEKPEDPGK